MAESSNSLHEPMELLSDDTINKHRAIVSVMEEMEAVDWYDQRAAACTDPELKAILEHNRDEEKEHAAMGLEWLRRKDAGWDEHLRTYLFTEGDILEIEEEDTGGGGGEGASAPSGGDGSLGIGSLKG
jgi:ferritin-like protein